MKTLMTLLVLFAPVYGGFSAQTVWEGGPGVHGPVTNWSDTFESHLRCGYDDMPGELFLNLQVGKHQVTARCQAVSNRSSLLPCLRELTLSG